MGHTMSERLKETLGMIESHGGEIREVQSDLQYYDLSTTGSTEVAEFVPKDVPTSVPALPKEANNDIRDDYILSRNITHTLIDMTGNAMSGAMRVAIDSQHPKAYEIFNQLAQTMRGLSKDLLDMQKIYKDITAERAAAAASSGKTVTNNNNIITTTASLADVLKAVKNNEAADNNSEADVIDVEAKEQ